MTLPRSAADVLSRHVTFEIESIDRMYLNVYQPRLQHTGGAVQFFTSHRGFAYASSALMAQMTEAFVGGLHRFIDAGHVPLVHLAKGQRKDDVMHEHLAGHDGSEGVLFVGRAVGGGVLVPAADLVDLLEQRASSRCRWDGLLGAAALVVGHRRGDVEDPAARDRPGNRGRRRTEGVPSPQNQG